MMRSTLPLASIGLLCLLLLVLANNSQGQEVFRSYDLGPLSYADFQSEVLDIPELIGEIYYTSRSLEQSVDVDGQVLTYQEWQVGIDTEQSWIDLTRVSDHTLDYFQVLFTIEHLYAKRYLHHSYPYAETTNYQQFQKIEQDKEILIDKFRRESSNGARPDIVSKWQARMADDLTDELETHHIPRYRLDSGSGIDLHIGGGYHRLTGSLGETFGNRVAIAMGINGYYKRLFFTLSGSIGFRDNPTDLAVRPGWASGTPTTDFAFAIGAGYHLHLGKRMRLTPYVGIAATDVYIDREEYEDVYQDLRDVRWAGAAGCFLDFPLGKLFTAAPNGNAISQEHGLRLGVTATLPTTKYGRYRGSHQAVQVSYYWRFGDVKSVLIDQS